MYVYLNHCIHGHVYLYIYIYMCRYIYIYMSIHTYIHTYIQTDSMIRARAVPGPLPEPGYMRTCSFELACLGLYIAKTVVAVACLSCFPFG